VGGKTIRVDNPGLDVRYWEGPSPLRLVLSNSGDVDHGAAVFRPTTNSRFGEGKESATLLFTHCDAEDFPGCRVVKLDNGSDSGTQILEYLYMAGIQSLIIEGGAETINHFTSLGLWDEARVFKGFEPFRNGVKAPVVEGDVASVSQFEMSTLTYIRNPKSST